MAFITCDGFSFAACQLRAVTVATVMTVTTAKAATKIHQAIGVR